MRLHNPTNVVFTEIRFSCSINLCFCSTMWIYKTLAARGGIRGYERCLYWFTTKNQVPHAHFVHCASHNLNLVLKDAVSCNRKVEEFFETVQSVYEFFGHSISRWWQQQSVYESGAPTLKTLNPTRFAGRYDAVFALKQRFCVVLKCLSQIILRTTKSSERNAALGIKKKIENFDFVFLLVLQDEILQIINLPSKQLQSEKIDLLYAHEQLQNALLSIEKLRNEFDSILKNVSDMKHVLDDYRVLQPQFLANALIKDLEQATDEFSKTFFNDVSSSFSSQLLSIRSTFQKDIASMKDIKELAHFLIIRNASLSSSYADVCTALFMFLTVPVTTTKAERTFSKLKLIKNYLRSTMAQERLSNLSLLSIENQWARKIDCNKVIDKFASMKSRKKSF